MWDTFIGKRIKGGGYALKGFFLLLRSEPSIQVQATIGLIMTGLGFYFNISAAEWMFQIFAIGMILAVEGLNTAVEKMADFIHPDHHPKIGFIKDISAGAVFFAALTAVIIGCIIYIPKL